MALIKTIKDSENNTIYPQTITAAILDHEGVTLENTLANIYNKEEIDNLIANNEGNVKILSVSERPETGEENIIYVVSGTTIVGSENSYEEWIWIENHWELLNASETYMKERYATATQMDVCLSAIDGINDLAYLAADSETLMKKADNNTLGTTTVIPKFWKGAYTGTGEADRLIELPFVAEHIEVSSSNIPEGNLTVGDINVYYIKSEMTGYTNENYTSYTHKMGGENYDYNSFTPNTMDISNWQNAQTVGYTGKGFKVSADLNVSGATYSYIAIGFSTTA